VHGPLEPWQSPLLLGSQAGFGLLLTCPPLAPFHFLQEQQFEATLLDWGYEDGVITDLRKKTDPKTGKVQVKSGGGGAARSRQPQPRKGPAAFQLTPPPHCPQVCDSGSRAQVRCQGHGENGERCGQPVERSLGTLRKAALSGRLQSIRCSSCNSKVAHMAGRPPEGGS
jgi:hypothetical protein